MRFPPLFALASLCLGGCASDRALDDHGGMMPGEAVDRSSSPITREQSWAIAEAEVTKRERWPKGALGDDGFVHGVTYSSRRINRGGWRVVAHRAVMENHPGGACAYDPIPAAIMVVNKQGTVTNYVRQLTNE